MKTDELIALLAAGNAPVRPHAAARRFAVALGCGAVGAALLLAILLGVRSDIGTASRLPMFWVKIVFPVAVAFGSVLAASRLARPGADIGRAFALIAAPVIAIWLLALYALLDSAPDARAGLVMGSSWAYCVVNVPLVAAPVLVALLWAIKGLAPTRPMLAGAAIGMLAGAIGAAIYALHCSEMAAPFIAVWYVAGMLIAAAAGAIAGRILLRW